MILLLERNDEVFIAYDQYSSRIVGLTEKDRLNPENYLLFKPKNRTNVVINSTSMRFLDLIRYSNIFDTELNYETIQIDIVDKLKELSTTYRMTDNPNILPGMVGIAVKDKAFIELGSGTGIVGLTASKLGAKKTTLTDIPMMHDILTSNIALNGLQETVDTISYHW